MIVNHHGLNIYFKSYLIFMYKLLKTLSYNEEIFKLQYNCIYYLLYIKLYNVVYFVMYCVCNVLCVVMVVY